MIEPNRVMILVKGKYVARARVVWEAAHGPIPTGHHIHHINGDCGDDRLENLDCIDPVEHKRRHPRMHKCKCGAMYCGDGLKMCNECYGKSSHTEEWRQYAKPAP